MALYTRRTLSIGLMPAPEGGLSRAASDRRCRRSVFRDIDIDSLDIGQVELADRALLEHFQPGLAFRSVAERLGYHQRIGADDFLHVAPDGLDAFDLEAEMFEPRRLRVVTDEVFHLPRQDQQRDPSIAEAVIAAAALVGDRKLVN